MIKEGDKHKARSYIKVLIMIAFSNSFNDSVEVLGSNIKVVLSIRLLMLNKGNLDQQYLDTRLL